MHSSRRRGSTARPSLTYIYCLASSVNPCEPLNSCNELVSDVVAAPADARVVRLVDDISDEVIPRAISHQLCGCEWAG
jgi:hypothetical protein